MTQTAKSDPLWHHKETLEARRLGKEPPPIYDGKPECGYFRTKNSVAAAVWWHNEPDQAPQLVCRIGNEMFYGGDVALKWSWLAGRNVEQAEAIHFFQHGDWRGASPRLAPAEADAGGKVGEPAPSDQPAGIGDNSRNAPEPPADPDEAALVKLHELIASTRDWLKGVKNKVSNDQEMQIATNKVGDLRAAYGKVKRVHKTKKEGITEAGRAVDKKWLHPSQDGEKASAHLLGLITNYTDAKNAEINRQRQEAEEARRKADEAHARKVAAAEKKGRTPPPPPPPPAPAPITRIESMTGRAISVGTRPELRMSDPVPNSVVALFEHYKGDTRLHEALMVLARSDWRQTSKVPPGCYVKQVPKAA